VNSGEQEQEQLLSSFSRDSQKKKKFKKNERKGLLPLYKNRNYHSSVLSGLEGAIPHSTTHYGSVAYSQEKYYEMY